jgi:hypothetical protein
MSRTTYTIGQKVYYANQPWIIRAINHDSIIEGIYSLNLDSLSGTATTCVRPRHLERAPADSSQNPPASSSSLKQRETKQMSNWLDEIRSATSEDAFKLVELPSGDYRMVVIKADQTELNRDMTWSGQEYKEGHPVINIILKPKEPLSVDQDELDECSDWQEKIQSIRVLSSHDFKATLVPLIAAAGLSLLDFIKPGEGTDLDELLAALKDKQVLVTMARTWNEKNEKMYSNIKKIGALE